MLHEGCVSKRLLNLLRELQGDQTLNGFFLVGGTALALLLGHRKSIDIDLFTSEKLNIPVIEQLLNQRFKNKYQVLNSQKIIYQVLINEIKVDFVYHPYKLVEPVFHESGIAFLGKRDIAAMKLHAIETSGNRAKDFYDIYFLLDEIPLEKMFEYYQIKYSTKNIFNAKRSLPFFDDIPADGWLEIKLVNKKISPDQVKKRIVCAINEYNKIYMNS